MSLTRCQRITGGKLPQIFTLAEGKEGPHCRNFAPLYGVKEDIATGTSNASLLYYLYKNGVMKSGIKYVFTQGEKLGRASRIFRTGGGKGEREP